ncbi:E3 ubiquitin-protein ligase FANCL isoform X2 [Ambystoma mexicanum]|uniref:E3 ubiquitin-protein ligase FANCL isoform X2 n=1 Tax=Ambystoma mexicanum TaxID=8296 RepID=UPI0037E947A3
MAVRGCMARQCPLLLPQDREKRVYDGFITAQDQDFRLRILLPSDFQLQNAQYQQARSHVDCKLKTQTGSRGEDNLTNRKEGASQTTNPVTLSLNTAGNEENWRLVRLQCSWPLKKVLHGYHQIVKQETALKNTHELHPPPPPQYYSSLVNEIESLGWDKLVYVDTEFSTIKLKADDTAGRKHLITLKFKTKYPVEPPDCIVDFPVPFTISWTPQSSLATIHAQFLAALDSLKMFWDVMDELDEKTWILEPEKPTRSATLRRIAIGNNVSVSIEVDPRHPTMIPECYFLGAEHVVNPLKMKLNNNIHMWDPENTLLQNLKDVLEIIFPSRSTIEKADYTMDCGICYAYRLDNAIPDQVCDDPRCGQPFHQACLYEWLRGLPSSRQSFNVIFGECPYCSKPIVLKMSIKKP